MLTLFFLIFNNSGGGIRHLLPRHAAPVMLILQSNPIKVPFTAVHYQSETVDVRFE